MDKKSKRVRKRISIIVAAGVIAFLGFGYFFGFSGEGVASKGSTAAQDRNAQDVTGRSDGLSAVVAAGSGLEDGWKAADVDSEHVYCVGSVSKIYSTAAVMKLVDEGKVKLDGSVTDYIPEFRLADPRYKDITVRMLMDHTSGLMGTSRLGMLLFGDNDHFHLDTILQTLSTQRLKAAPGEYAAYCNDGFDLLGIIVERVTGISFTDYVEKYIAAPTGGSMTGTGYDYDKFDNLAPAFSPVNTQYEKNVATSLGAGGVYASASDVARFGSAFFSGNDSLISEELKKEMAVRWNGDGADPYTDGSGLGWDEVELEGYEDAGIKVLGKGGDDGLNHAYLLVAPDEKISISVLSNGGSSALNGLLSYELLKTITMDMGISIPEKKQTEIEPVYDIPDSYDEYAGSYVVSNTTGETIDEITFPDHKYMHVVSIGAYRSGITDYVLTKDGSFAELAYEVKDSGLGDMRPAINPNLITFSTGKDGKQLLAASVKNVFPEIGWYKDKSYVGQRMDENPVSEAVVAAWQQFGGTDQCLVNDIYSSENYDAAVSHIELPEGYPGYVFAVNGMGTRVLRIVDEKHATAFQTIPSSRSRDMIDVEIRSDGDGVSIAMSDGTEYCVDTAFPEFDGSEKEIALETGRAKWYRIADTAVNSEVVIAERPENSAVYVFNKFGEVVYTSHILGMTNILPMPEGGKILFLGETGGSVKLK